MARKILCVDDLGEGFCYDSTTEKINTVGGTSTPVAIEDSAGNTTVLNGNGNIPVSADSVGYVNGAGELVIPGALLDLDITNSTFYTTATAPGAYGGSPNQITSVFTNNSGEKRLYTASLYGFEFAITPLTKFQIGHRVNVTGAVTATAQSVIGAFGNGAHNIDHAETTSISFILNAGQTVTFTALYLWQNTQGTSVTFNGANLRLQVISVPAE